MADDGDVPSRPPNPSGKPEPERARSETRPPASERGEKERHERPERPERPERDDHDNRLTETIRQKLEQLVPDLVKKTFAAGMGAVFTTEEGIRRVVGGARESLPEVAGYLASSADGAKDKVFEIIARETREFLSTLNLTEEIAKILTTLSFEIKTEIRFIPNSERFGGAEPDVKASVRLKRSDEGKNDNKKEEDSRDSRSRLRFWRRDEGGSDGDGDDNTEK